jgi:pantothenate kinase-related protein Tda10
VYWLRLDAHFYIEVLSVSSLATRAMPLVLSIVGDSGTGKTEMAIKLSTAMCASTIGAEVQVMVAIVVHL